MALATSSTNSEVSNKKAHENDDTNPRSCISGKAKAGDSANLRKSKPVVLAICAAPVGSDVIASSPIVLDEGLSVPCRCCYGRGDKFWRTTHRSGYYHPTMGYYFFLTTLPS